MKALLLALCLLATPAYANQEETIHQDGGGIILDYIARYVDWYNAQKDVRVDGECDSACTLVLAIIPINHICATRNAEFGFHSASVARTGEPLRYDAVMTALMWHLYNDVDHVHRVLVKHHFATPRKHPDLVMIDAQEFVKPCPPLEAEKTP